MFFGSALKNDGITEFLDDFYKYVPLKKYNPAAELSSYVYKISHDSTGKRLTHMKILAGTLKAKDMLGDEKVNDIRMYSGEKYQSAQESVAGDVCIISGLASTHGGDTFGTGIRVTAPVLAPALEYAVKYSDDMDSSRMLEILKILEEEDPSLHVNYSEQTREIYISLMGEVQAEVLKRTILDRFGITATFTDGKICYKETVSHTVEGVGHFEPLRHYAEVHIRIEPLERGEGLQFECDIPEELLAKNWQRLIYTHLTERTHYGVLTGSPLTDVKLSLVSGKAHLKHTEGGDFRQATYRAIRQGLMELKYAGFVRLLEPYYEYTLELPDEYVGRAMTDINRMSGTSSISENDHEAGITVLTGKSPVSTMNGYVKEVTAYTKGLGKLSLSLAGYDLCHNEDEVLEASTYDPDADLRNPSSSVFCSHGAGTVITWDEVPDYMHISYASRDGALGTTSDGIIADLNDELASAEYKRANAERIRRSESDDIFISTEEVDSIIRSSSHANENGRQGAYKGVSEASRKAQRNSSSSDGKPVVYRGAKIKPKYILVDGYNVIHAWKELSDLAAVSLDGAAGKLNDYLCNYQAITGIPLIVVYDAYKVKGHQTEEKSYNNIIVVYTKEAQTADRYIEQYAHENSSKYDITVITSDGIEQTIVRGNGGNIISSRDFEEDYQRAVKSFNNQFRVT